MIHRKFDPRNRSTIYLGDTRDFLKTLPDESVQLVVTSPPYNIGKEYEDQVGLTEYVQQQGEVINECVRVLRKLGSTWP